jgi:DNA-binding transcriptional ArsR family regulator
MESPLDVLFAALSDPTRRGMLARLAQGEASVGELAAPYGISLPAVSKHIRVLEQAGLLQRTRIGRVHRCRLNAEALRPIGDWIEQYRSFWEVRLDRLDEYLKQAPAEGREEASCVRKPKRSRSSSSSADSTSPVRRSSKPGRGRGR